MSGLRILITNDDGIDAPGLAVMRAIAEAMSDDVWVVAPSGNQSGAGHRFSFGRDLALEQRGPRDFAVVDGSPADCVVAGCTHVLGDHPADLVLSGVNNGQNLGDIINCSGTAAGAREGTLQGAVGIAMSQGINYDVTRDVVWDNATRFGAEVARTIFDAAAGRDTWYNVNFPFCAPDKVTGARVVAAQRFSRSPMRYYQSDTPGHFFVAIPEIPQPLDQAADFHAFLHNESITVTPVALRQTDTAALAGLEAAFRA